jgi:hypothetical protein
MRFALAYRSSVAGLEAFLATTAALLTLHLL